MASSPDSNKNSMRQRFMAYVRNNLPYSLEMEDSTNPKYHEFNNAGAKRSQLLHQNSVSASKQGQSNNSDLFGILRDKDTLDNTLYASVQTDKNARLRDYRTIAGNSEVVECLDEICNEFINTDDTGRIVQLHLHSTDMDATQKSELLKEFQRYVGYYDLANRGYEYLRQLLVEGELFFEQVIHKDKVDAGVLGVIMVPNALVDPVYDNIQNLLIKDYIYRKPIFDPNEPQKVERYDMIPLNRNQLVYINSGAYNDTRTMVVPFIENARRPYRQLTLIEDAIVIYRLVNAPERLVFNIDVGNMSPANAEAYMRKQMQQYWSNKTFDFDKNDIAQKFNPQSMLDAFWFAKRTGSEGSSVNKLAPGQNLGELADLQFFIKKLYRALKVPTSRLDPQQAAKDGSEILREELKFARFIIRQQQRFAAGLKKGFITHLKLMEVWDELELTDNEIDVEFNVPTNFYEMRDSQRTELRINNYNSLANAEMISSTYMQKRVLKWSDDEILANRKFAKLDAAAKWEVAQIEQAGPNWRAQQIASGMAAGDEGGTGMDIGAASGGGGGMPPSFGGGPADLSNDATTDAPEQSVTDEAPPSST